MCSMETINQTSTLTTISYTKSELDAILQKIVSKFNKTAHQCVFKKFTSENTNLFFIDATLKTPQIIQCGPKWFARKHQQLRDRSFSLSSDKNLNFKFFAI